MINKIIVWALFDDSSRSFYNNGDDRFEIHSFGINNLTENNVNYHKVNISLTNSDLINYFSKFPKPDIILASPPCQSWSNADAAGRMCLKIEGNKYTIQNYRYYEMYNIQSQKCKKRDFVKKEISRLNGEGTIGATILLIKHFEPTSWVIENPTSGLIFNWIEQHWNFEGIRNKFKYSHFSIDYSWKPTTFFSNVDLNRINNHIIEGENLPLLKNVAKKKRSEIPGKLVKLLLNKLYIEELNKINLVRWEKRHQKFLANPNSKRYQEIKQLLLSLD